MGKGTKSLKGAALINAVGKYITIILQLVVNAILSRILSAEDYGVIAVITVFSTFFISLSDMGFGAAIVQRKDLTKDDINRIFSCTFYIAAILALIFSALSFPISVFYHNHSYIKLGGLLSISLFFNALNMVPNGLMNKEKKFVRIAIRTIVAYLIASIVAVFLAFQGWRYYSIVIQTMMSSFIIFVWNYIETKPHIDFSNCISSVKKVMNYSGFQFAFNMINYLSRNLDNLLIGKFMGDAALGYYYKAYNLMLYPVNNLTGVISPVLHPLLSDYQNQKRIIYDKYMKVVKLLFLIASFIAPFCFLASEEIISILYGSQWSDSTVCFKILSLAILPQMVGSSAGAIYQSLGKTKILFQNGLINTFITICAIIFGVVVGKNIVILSIAVSSAYIIHFFTVYYMLVQIAFEYSFVNFFKDLYKEFLIVFIMVILTAVYPLRITNIFVSSMVKGIYLGVSYVILLWITKEHNVLLKMIRRSK